jgi:hypothetical protein
MHENLQRRPVFNNQQTTSGESEVPSVGSIVSIYLIYYSPLNKYESQVWAAGRTRAQQAINLYANLDYLRPYFDVEPKEVLHRYENKIY